MAERHMAVVAANTVAAVAADPAKVARWGFRHQDVCVNNHNLPSS